MTLGENWILMESTALWAHKIAQESTSPDFDDQFRQKTNTTRLIILTNNKTYIKQTNSQGIEQEEYYKAMHICTTHTTINEQSITSRERW